QNAIFWNGRGNALSNLNRYEEAITCYDKVLEINPSLEYPWTSKGLALLDLRRYSASNYSLR
ncbi:MAG: tetratricopeptide repeat protein, partial [Cyanobacteria bacterium J06635_10]